MIYCNISGGLSTCFHAIRKTLKHSSLKILFPLSCKETCVLTHFFPVFPFYSPVKDRDSPVKDQGFPSKRTVAKKLNCVFWVLKGNKILKINPDPVLNSQIRPSEYFP